MTSPTNSIHDWSPSPDDPSYHVRRAWAFETIEDVFNRQKHGEHTQFLGADVTAARPFATKTLLDHARTAWVSLRYSLPTLAAHTEQDSDGNTLITYRTASSAADAQDWAKRTVLLDEKHKSLDDLRYELGQKLVPDANGDQTFLYLIVRSDTSFGVLLHTSHVPFDGVAAKVIITRFLKKLALLLDASHPDLDLKWGEEYVNLTPAAGQVLGPNEIADGAEYGETLNSVMMGFATGMARGHGFKVRGDTGPGPTRRLSLKLSADETAKFVQFAKSNSFTVNHVVHAALMMVCLYDNPPTDATPSDAALVSPSLVNTRSRLQPAYSGRDGYPGLCLAGSAITVPLSILRSSDKSEKEQLVELASAIKAEYLKQKAYPSLLAITNQQAEMMLPGLRNVGADSPPWMAPAYVGDGLGEDYMDRTYPNRDGSTILTLDGFFISVNKTDPGALFRAFSWMDRLILSADYNERTAPREVVQTWMDKWAELLRAVL